MFLGIIPEHILPAVIFLMMPAAFLIVGSPFFFWSMGIKISLIKTLSFCLFCFFLQGLWVWLAFHWNISMIIPNIFLITCVFLFIASVKFLFRKILIIFSLIGFLHGFWLWAAFIWSEGFFPIRGAYYAFLGFIYCSMVGLVFAFFYFIVGLIFYLVYRTVRKSFY